MLERDSLGSSVGAFLTGAAVTSGPWLLTTAVLVAVRLAAAGAGLVGVTDIERVITIVYAVVIVLSAPIDIVLTRYTSDRVYERRPDQIAGPLCRVVALGLVGFAGLGALAMTISGVPLELAVPGTILAAIVGGQWLLLSAAGGLSSPGIILRAFAVGAPVSAFGWLALAGASWSGAAAPLHGFAAGQLVTLVLLLWGTLRALPAHEDPAARILPAFREYWLLAAAALAFHAGLWSDKVVVFAIAGEQPASRYAAQAAVAWLSMVPACAYLFVRVETTFHRGFQAFYTSLHQGASLPELQRGAREVRLEVGRTLSGTLVVQACTTLLCLVAAPAITARLGLGGGGPHTFEWLLAGTALQVMALSATLLLYYFDFRVEAAAVALVQLVANTALTAWVGVPSPALGLGYAAACALTCAVAIAFLSRRMSTLLERTFQSQPFASES